MEYIEKYNDLWYDNYMCMHLPRVKVWNMFSSLDITSEKPNKTEHNDI